MEQKLKELKESHSVAMDSQKKEAEETLEKAKNEHLSGVEELEKKHKGETAKMTEVRSSSL